MSCSIDLLSTSNIISALIGGFISSLLFPLITYFVIRFFNKFNTKIFIDEIASDEIEQYSTHNLRITNNSLSSLKNVIVYVKIEDFSESDIITNPNIKTFVSKGKIDYGMLSWAKNINNSNHPNIDLNQGESGDINFIRYHSAHNLVEFASEQGFSDQTKKSRVLLSNKNYSFNITITADNMVKKEMKFQWDSEKKKIFRSC